MRPRDSRAANLDAWRRFVADVTAPHSIRCVRYSAIPHMFPIQGSAGQLEVRIAYSRFIETAGPANRRARRMQRLVIHCYVLGGTTGPNHVPAHAYVFSNRQIESWHRRLVRAEISRCAVEEFGLNCEQGKGLARCAMQTAMLHPNSFDCCFQSKPKLVIGESQLSSISRLQAVIDTDKWQEEYGYRTWKLPQLAKDRGAQGAQNNGF
eukprot:6205970-Pleurochrysis_carterae.AAC.8